MHYCGKILGENDLIDFIDLVSCTGWSMALSTLINKLDVQIIRTKIRAKFVKCTHLKTFCLQFPWKSAKLLS